MMKPIGWKEFKNFLCCGYEVSDKNGQESLNQHDFTKLTFLHWPGNQPRLALNSFQPIGFIITGIYVFIKVMGPIGQFGLFMKPKFKTIPCHLAKVQGYDTRFIQSITQTRLVLTWTKLGATDYFDTCIIMIMTCSAHSGLLLKPMKLIELTD